MKSKHTGFLKSFLHRLIYDFNGTLLLSFDGAKD